MIVGLTSLVQKFKLRRNQIRELVWDTVSIFVDTDVDVRKALPLPASTAMKEHVDLMARMQHRQLSQHVNASSGVYATYTFEADEGQVNKVKRLVMNVNVPQASHRLPARFHAGARPIPSCSGRHECDGMLRCIEDYGWSLCNSLGMTTDSASTMETARLLFQGEREQHINRLIESGMAPSTYALLSSCPCLISVTVSVVTVTVQLLCGKIIFHSARERRFLLLVDTHAGALARPSFMPPHLQKKFFVRVNDGKESRLLYPVDFYRNPDIPHGGKNAEKAMTEGCFGGVCVADGQYKKDLLKAALFRFARLVAKNEEFYLLIKKLALEHGLTDVRAHFDPWRDQPQVI